MIRKEYAVKKRYANFVIAGLILSLLMLAFGVLFVTSNTQSEDFRTHTGTVADFDWHEERWYEGFLGISQGSYFTVCLEDGSCYEATGIFYDRINTELFSDLRVGEAIDLSFHENPNKICGIQYQGRVYLSSEDMLESYYAANTTKHKIGIAMIVAAVILYIPAVVFLYKHRKMRKEHPDAYR